MKNIFDCADASNIAYLETLSIQDLQDLQDLKDLKGLKGLKDLKGFADAQFVACIDEHNIVKKKFVDLTKSNFQISQSFAIDDEYQKKQLKVFQLIRAYRFNGHLAAKLDPLARPVVQSKIQNTTVPSLSDYGLNNGDLDLEFDAGSLQNLGRTSLRNIIKVAEFIYCNTLGIEYMHISNTSERYWIQNNIEFNDFRSQISNEYKKWLLQRIMAAECFEKFLHTKYVGQKRFSLEGGESLIPMLNSLIEHAGSNYKIKLIDLGMAHRGRLNVLINILGKHADVLFQEFTGNFNLIKNQTGDVKYHLGCSSEIKTNGCNIHLSLAFNPSHLELVNPVVEGHMRYHQEVIGEGNRNKALAVIIHGDAALSGQGVVMETLNMSQSSGYTTQGTLHIVINNQIGFTTSNQNDARSTLYCTDIMKAVDAPIFHVNGDDPEMASFIVKLALDYRMKFKKDVIVDLVCYRRHGHNEADEPAVTQPMMYKIIRSMQSVYTKYGKKLIAEKVISQQEIDDMVKHYRQSLKNGQKVAFNVIKSDGKNKTHSEWSKYFHTTWDMPYDTSLTKEKLFELNAKLQKLPKNFKLHPIVVKTMKERDKMAKGEIDADWGFAEIMAYASLADIGVNVRLSGQDCGRGTFFHRHAIFHNQLTLESYIPLQNLHKTQGNVRIIDSVLSEEAVLGFEYGYAAANPESLVIWEAQFGDFANGAQAIIDQFITSAEVKWGRLCGLVMMLPHGLEGQGPEHSSARVERFLQSCANFNIQVCVPSSASQVFHLLRRQIIRNFRKPLIILTPKSLLRNKLANSPLYRFVDDVEFKLVIRERYKNIKDKKVTRVVLCSGKVFYELLARRQKDKINNVAILRIEQLYPFPHKVLVSELNKYGGASEIVWCQEEPINQGSWYTNRHNFIKCIESCDNSEKKLLLVARTLSAASAEGSIGLHNKYQNIIIEEALGIQAIN